MEKNIRNLRIGDVLKEYGYINEAQVEAALAYQKTHQKMCIRDRRDRAADDGVWEVYRCVHQYKQ